MATTRSRTDFHPLRVEVVDELTDDSAAVTFAVPDELTDTFAFSPGQSLTIKMGEQRRSYSICAPAGHAPRIGVREVAGGAVSGWLVHQVRAGDVIDVQAPAGSFTPDLAAPGRHVLIAAGSGITPMLSIAASVLSANPESSVTLLYGNRRTDSVMFADDVADLKDAHPARMRLVHVLSREPQEVELFSGRLDADKLRTLLPATLGLDSVDTRNAFDSVDTRHTFDSVDTRHTFDSVDHWWLCGPYGMVTDAIDVLRDFGVDGARIHRELFYVGDDPPDEARHDDAPSGPGAEVTVVLDGRSTTVTVAPDVPVLDSAQKVRPDLPFACKGGVCGTCRALVTAGEVRMRRNYALEQKEIAAGYVLTCQALPVSDTATIDFDS